jgi:excisionase family DNA binding protein
MKNIEERLSAIEDALTLTKNVLNLEEVCSFTGLSKSHIYKLTCYKKIPFYKQAKHLYFDRIEIENWLKSSRYATMDELERQASTYVTANQVRRGR